jgi:hypothetical protein
MNIFRKLLTIIICHQFLIVSIAYSQITEEVDVKQSASQSKDLNLQELALPSEVKDINKQSGAIYYNNSVKNKVLIPAHIWGEVNRPGLHFVPNDTTLIKGLSMAGGPSGSAKLTEVSLSRNTNDGQVKQYVFDLKTGGELDAHLFKIEPGDSIFIKRDHFLEDRNYYTSWIGIVISIISTIVLLQKVD